MCASPFSFKVRHFVEWMLFQVRGGSQGKPQPAGEPISVTKKESERFKRAEKVVIQGPAASAPAATEADDSASAPASAPAAAPTAEEPAAAGGEAAADGGDIRPAADLAAPAFDEDVLVTPFFIAEAAGVIGL